MLFFNFIGNYPETTNHQIVFTVISFGEFSVEKYDAEMTHNRISKGELELFLN